MDEQLEQIRQQQKDAWNKFSPGWKKWDELTMDFLKPMGDEIVRLLNPKGNEVVLDVAAGASLIHCPRNTRKTRERNSEYNTLLPRQQLPSLDDTSFSEGRFPAEIS